MRSVCWCFLLSILTFFFSLSKTYAATRTAVSNGSWTNTGTWDCNCVPATTDNVIIPDGVRVTINFPGLSLIDLTDEVITIAGELRLSSAYLSLNSTDVVTLTSTGRITTTGLGGLVTSGLATFTTFPISGPATITNGALPVSIDYFLVVRQSDGVLVKWASSVESDLRDYSIERSIDGIVFHTIGQITPNTTSAVIKEYEHLDPFPLAGQSYYRLRATDIDGTSEVFSAVRYEQLDIPFAIHLFPNPASNSSSLFVRSNFEFIERAQLIITSASGKIVLNEQLKGFESIINLSEIPPGVYLANVKTGPKEFIRRLVIR